jgi:hypothetical protein
MWTFDSVLGPEVFTTGRWFRPRILLANEIAGRSRGQHALSLGQVQVIEVARLQQIPKRQRMEVGQRVERVVLPIERGGMRMNDLGHARTLPQKFNLEHSRCTAEVLTIK